MVVTCLLVADYKVPCILVQHCAPAGVTEASVSVRVEFRNRKYLRTY